MPESRISLVYQLAKRHCMARIDCLTCDQSVVVSAAIMARLLGRLEQLDNVEKRARRTRCMPKGKARIIAIRLSPR